MIGRVATAVAVLSFSILPAFAVSNGMFVYNDGSVPLIVQGQGAGGSTVVQQGQANSTPWYQVEVGSANGNAGISPSVAGSGASALVVKASAGNLYGAYATCTAACWLMIFNATSAPADGATPAGVASGNLQDCIPIAAGATGGVNYAPGPGEVFSTGITLVISSTACATKTASNVGFIHGSAR